MEEENNLLLAGIRLLARVIEDDLTEDDLHMPAGLLKVVAMGFLEAAGHSRLASLLIPFTHHTDPLSEHEDFVLFCQSLLNDALSTSI